MAISRSKMKKQVTKPPRKKDDMPRGLTYFRKGGAASKKSKGSKICPSGKAWAKRTFDTYPSAYANMAEGSDLAAETGEEFGIVANKRAWIEVRGSDGTVFRNREMSPGEVYFPRTGAGWTITVRDGGAFEWQLGDLTAAAVGEPGQALYSISVDGALGAAVDARSAAMAEAPRSGDRPR
mgnify:CR=1 FL=1